jgi:hypothetical protein
MGLPAAYGGGERTAVDRFIVVEELLRWGARRTGATDSAR